MATAHDYIIAHSLYKNTKIALGWGPRAKEWGSTEE